MTIQYVFKDSPVAIKNAKLADAQVIGDSLSKIATANGGKLEPRFVSAAAKSPRHPLHKHFEWNDEICGQKYREDQARELIRCIRLVDDQEPDKKLRAFMSISTPDGTSYRSYRDVMGSLELQVAVMKQAAKDLEAFEKRYSELGEICDLVREAREKIERKRKQMEDGDDKRASA